MEKHIAGIFIALTAIMMACSAKKEIKAYNQGINLIPQPVELTITDSLHFTLTANTVVFSEGNLENETAYLTRKVKASTGYAIQQVQEIPSENFIKLSIDKSLDTGEEGYLFNSCTNGVEISATTSTGIFYGIQTLFMLLPAEIESSTAINTVEWTIPSVSIKDFPRFKYRGLHIDACRHFRSVEMIKKHIDILALYKINRIHWHLTDDQGWRIEIKKYPKLTEIGSVRTEGDGEKYGPFFYTQEEIKDIVAYATSRHIDVIPEIEMPGHGMAALTAYPEFSCTGGPFAQPRIIWGVEDEVYCVGNEATFAFLEDILKEVFELFPSKYIHLGGDECPKTRWKACPKCQERAKSLGLKATANHTVEEQLQSYFVTRMEKFANSYGKSIIGWDEILEGGLAPSATVMSWRGIEGGLAAARQNHDVIMTPGSAGLYIDWMQGPSEVEPVAIGGTSTVKKVYNYEPVPEQLVDSMRHHILGAQCNLWTEYVNEDWHWEYMMYPRVMALAELTWTPKENKDFEKFQKKLDNTLVRLTLHGSTYHMPMPEGTLTRNVVFLTDSTEISFCNSANLPMVYTLNGNDPDVQSERYTAPIKVGGSGIIKIATLSSSTGILSRIRTITYTHVEEPVKSITSAKFETPDGQQGIALLSIAPGLYPKKTDWDKARFETKEVVDKLHDYDKWDMNKPSLGIFEGYFNADTTGVYTFTTDMDNLWIDDNELIVNEKISRYNINKVQVALCKGKHYYKLVFNNMIKGGWPNSWNLIGFRYLAPGAKEWKNAGADELSTNL